MAQKFPRHSIIKTNTKQKEPSKAKQSQSEVKSSQGKQIYTGRQAEKKKKKETKRKKKERKKETMDLQNALLSLTASASNTANVKAAERFLVTFQESPESVPALFQALARSEHAGVRQLSAVLLRKTVNRFWVRYAAEQQQSLKESLIGLLGRETVGVVRRAIGGVIATLARHLLPMGQWPELLTLLVNLAASQSDEHRAAAFFLMFQMVDALRMMTQQHQNIAQMLAKGLSDASTMVRKNALRAGAALTDRVSLDAEFNPEFKQLLPHMMRVARECVHDEAGAEAVEIFADLVVSPACRSFETDAISFALDVAKNVDVDIAPRECALTILARLAEERPKMLERTRAIPSMIGALLKIILDEPDDDNDADYSLVDDDPDNNDSDERNAHKIVCTCLDRLACALPDRLIFPPVLSCALQGMRSGQAKPIRVGLFAIGVIAEGCCSPLNDALQGTRARSSAALADCSDASCRRGSSLRPWTMDAVHWRTCGQIRGRLCQQHSK